MYAFRTLWTVHFCCNVFVGGDTYARTFSLFLNLSFVFLCLSLFFSFFLSLLFSSPSSLSVSPLLVRSNANNNNKQLLILYYTLYKRKMECNLSPLQIVFCFLFIFQSLLRIVVYKTSFLHYSLLLHLSRFSYYPRTLLFLFYYYSLLGLSLFLVLEYAIFCVCLLSLFLIIYVIFCFSLSLFISRYLFIGIFV